MSHQFSSSPLRPQWMLPYHSPIRALLNLRALFLKYELNDSVSSKIQVTLWLIIDDQTNERIVAAHFSHINQKITSSLLQGPFLEYIHQQQWEPYQRFDQESIYRLHSIQQLLLPPSNTRSINIRSTKMDIMFTLVRPKGYQYIALEEALKTAQLTEYQYTAAYDLSSLEGQLCLQETAGHTFLFCSVDHYFIEWAKARPDIITILHISAAIDLPHQVGPDYISHLHSVWHNLRTPQSTRMAIHPSAMRVNQTIRLKYRLNWTIKQPSDPINQSDIAAFFIPTSVLQELRYGLLELPAESLQLLSIAELSVSKRTYILVQVAKGLIKEKSQRDILVNTMSALSDGEPMRMISRKPLVYLSTKALLTPPLKDDELTQHIIRSQKQSSEEKSHLFLISYLLKSPKPEAQLTISSFPSTRFFMGESLKMILWPKRQLNMQRWLDSAYLRLTPQALDKSST